ncbi:MAG: DGQHR domain-containing protein [Candidatus Thorarchaeota archaeon]
MAGTINVNAIKITQNEREFYLFKIKARDLLDIAYFNPREIDRESGIQRPFKLRRSKEIAEYIDSEESVLANNIIVSIESKNLRYNAIHSNRGKLSIRRKKGCAFVIDGQHRLRAFELTEKKDFELPISGFVDLSLAEIAEIFVKINYYQKPVNKSLVYDLLGISSDIFPDYVEFHEITERLNQTIGSPWFGLIKMLGIGKGIITQAAFITALEKNKILDTTLEKFSLDKKIIILSNYFEAIKELFPSYWGHRGSIISKTLGFNALVKIFPRIFEHIVSETNGFKTKDIYNFIEPLKRINFESEDITSLGGIKGVTTLAKLMEKRIFS